MNKFNEGYELYYFIQKIICFLYLNNKNDCINFMNYFVVLTRVSVWMWCVDDFFPMFVGIYNRKSIQTNNMIEPYILHKI